MSNEVALVSVADVEKMATAIAKSQLFSMKTPEQAFALMMIAQAEGRHPASAAQDYHIIQNHPALKADAILARFQQAGGKVKWTEYTDEVVEGEFTHEQGGALKVKWTVEMAKRIGLYPAKDNWKNYPRAMLRARVISEGVRTIYPKVLCGFYAEEEVADFNEVSDVPRNPLFAKKTDAEVIDSVTQPAKIETKPVSCTPEFKKDPEPTKDTQEAPKDQEAHKTREQKLAEIKAVFAVDELGPLYDFFLAKKWISEGVDLNDMGESYVNRAFENVPALKKVFDAWNKKRISDINAAAAGKVA